MAALFFLVLVSWGVGILRYLKNTVLSWKQQLRFSTLEVISFWFPGQLMQYNMHTLIIAFKCWKMKTLMVGQHIIHSSMGGRRELILICSNPGYLEDRGLFLSYPKLGKWGWGFPLLSSDSICLPLQMTSNYCLWSASPSVVSVRSLCAFPLLLRRKHFVTMVIKQNYFLPFLF